MLTNSENYDFSNKKKNILWLEHAIFQINDDHLYCFETGTFNRKLELQLPIECDSITKSNMNGLILAIGSYGFLLIDIILNRIIIQFLEKMEIFGAFIDCDQFYFSNKKGSWSVVIYQND